MNEPAALSSNDRAILDKTIWRVMPLVALCMAVGTIDRSNIGFAKLSMAKDLGMSEAAFGFGSSLFYVGYLLFEIPSALAAHRYGARTWFVRIMATWGLATLLLAATNSATTFYILRFGLGMAEAGLYPALLYYVSIWFPKSQQPRAMAFLTVGSALGNGIGALISGPMLDMTGVGGLHGWQWIFIVTGLMPMVTILFVLWKLKDSPDRADFLDDTERSRLVAMIEREAAPVTTSPRPWAAVGDPRVLGHGLVYAIILTALFGMVYWSPSVIKTFGVTGTQNGLMVALPWAIDIVLLLTLPKLITTTRAVLVTMIILCIIGAATAALAAASDSNALRYIALLVGIPAISLTLGLYWTFPIRIFRGASSAAAIAAISMIGNFGGIVAQNGMPAVAEAGGNPSAALLVPGVCLFAIFIGCAIALLRDRTAAPDAAGAIAEPLEM